MEEIISLKVIFIISEYKTDNKRYDQKLDEC